ncbi:SMI1/KNR4 family protein [Variovorax sp. PAMC28562]|uniref:SMI1/KNR4 family protein n=1 Tax=Variovorax sp. PAMC28562 TaxID=2762323 RepID=UPI00164E2450|nr:SMI1/KNR4 family protein [Variovorax sp. PAMC28562]QNK73737.1 SMI1/KNR4 family protein [Variovorax sp. PAMC28562]
MKTVRERLQAATAAGTDAWIAGGADEAQIQALERSLGVRLPPSYRRFLALTGALNLGGIEVAGIIDGNALDLSGGSTYGETIRARDDFALPPTLLVIQPDGDAPHCLDLSSADSSGEMAVVCFQLNTKSASEVAQDFEHWLSKWVLPADVTEA